MTGLAVVLTLALSRARGYVGDVVDSEYASGICEQHMSAVAYDHGYGGRMQSWWAPAVPPVSAWQKNVNLWDLDVALMSPAPGLAPGGKT